MHPDVRQISTQDSSCFEKEAPNSYYSSQYPNQEFITSRPRADWRWCFIWKFHKSDHLKQIRSRPVTEWNGRSLWQMSLACQSAPLERAERQTMSGWHTSDIYPLILSSRSDSLSHSCQNHIRKFPNKAEEPVRIWMIFCVTLKQMHKCRVCLPGKSASLLYPLLFFIGLIWLSFWKVFNRFNMFCKVENLRNWIEYNRLQRMFINPLKPLNFYHVMKNWVRFRRKVPPPPHGNGSFYFT